MLPLGIILTVLGVLGVFTTYSDHQACQSVVTGIMETSTCSSINSVFIAAVLSLVLGVLFLVLHAINNR